MLVVDSCVAVKWFVNEHYSRRAYELLRPGTELAAPDSVLLEVANALWKNHRLGRIEERDLRSAVTDLPRYLSLLIPSADLIDDAADLALAFDHPVYDCLYVVASRKLGARLVTSDAKLAAKLAGTPDATRVVLLSDWKP